MIRKNLEKVKNKIAVVSLKGGVGKTVFSCALALCLSKNFKTGLLDLDILNPCCHKVLGIDISAFPREDFGILPIEFKNIKFMSIAFFTKEKPLSLRGKYLNEVFLEMLSITRWGELDFLIIDTPPGASDILMNILKYIKDCKFIVISTPSLLSNEKICEIVGKERVLGIIFNMVRKKEPNDFEIPFFENIERYFGKNFEKSEFVKRVESLKIVREMLSHEAGHK